MPRRFEGGDLIIASHNAGKVREIRHLLEPYGATVIAANELGLAEPEETGTSFTENAELKANAAATAGGRPALSDDSGLVVPALGGQPGIYSARWAGPNRDFGVAMLRVERELEAHADHSAYFACALALAWPDGHCEVFLCSVLGMLVWPPRGSQGFGYDPMFVPLGHELTFGEMEPDRKHAMSHRADAFRKLVDACFA